jgi:hypothetical protein
VSFSKKHDDVREQANIALSLSLYICTLTTGRDDVVVHDGCCSFCMRARNIIIALTIALTHLLFGCSGALGILAGFGLGYVMGAKIRNIYSSIVCLACILLTC